MLNKIISVQNGKEVVLSGAKLTTFLAEQEVIAAEFEALKAQQDAKAAARESALAKLAELGLTAEEIAAL